MDKGFSIRTYYKQELAMRYFPDSDPHVAQTRLGRWISRCQPLREKLQACQLSPWSKFYTPRQVALIVDYLGEP